MTSTKSTLTNFVADPRSNVFLTAAQELGWEITILQKEGSLSEIKKGSLTYRICGDVLSANDEVAISISFDKYLTHLVLRNDIPYVTHPHKFQISDVKEETIEQLLKKYHTLVVKPVDFNEGVGVTTSLESVSEVMEAVEKVKQLGQEKVMIENHVEIVNEFRIILWKGKVLDVLRRIPAYIIGDGQHTIEQLVQEKNQYRLTKFNGAFETIKMDDNFYTSLKKQKLTADSILEKDHHLKLKSTCNLAQGGETERIPVNAIHPKYQYIFKKVYELTNLNYCGVDLICPDITIQPEVDVAAINELNGDPAITVGYYADLAANTPLWGAKTILSAIENDPVQTK